MLNFLSVNIYIYNNIINHVHACSDFRYGTYMESSGECCKQDALCEPLDLVATSQPLYKVSTSQRVQKKGEVRQNMTGQ